MIDKYCLLELIRAEGPAVPVYTAEGLNKITLADLFVSQISENTVAPSGLSAEGECILAQYVDCTIGRRNKHLHNTLL